MFLVSLENGLIKKLRLISKFITCDFMRIFPNISRIKGNYTKKPGHLTQRNVKKLFSKVMQKMWPRD